MTVMIGRWHHLTGKSAFFKDFDDTIVAGVSAARGMPVWSAWPEAWINDLEYETYALLGTAIATLAS